MEELERFTGEDQLLGAPILIFANKQDLPNVISAQDIADKIYEWKTLEKRPWMVQPICATADLAPIHKGMDWLGEATKAINNNQK